MSAVPRTEGVSTDGNAVQLVIAGLVGGVVAWSVASTVLEMAERWNTSPENSHGWLVPIFALYLLWTNRPTDSGEIAPGWLWIAITAVGAGLFLGADSLPIPSAATAGLTLFGVGGGICAFRWSGLQALSPSWIGCVVLVAVLAGKVFAGVYYYEWLDQMAIVPIVVGAAWAVGGKKFLWKVLPSAAFLVFMIPLPFSLESMLRAPLRQVGTTISTAIMQTIGLPAFAEGYVIVVGDRRIGVAEACSGLRMLMVFAATAAAVALTGRRPLWQNIIVLLSAVPIALISNVFRITVTGVLYTWGLEKLAEITYHDLAGWAMMPLGLGILAAELWYMDRLIVFDTKRPMAVGIGPVQLPR